MQYVLFLVTEHHKDTKSYWWHYLQSLPKEYLVPASHEQPKDIVAWVQRPDDPVLKLVQSRKEKMERLFEVYQKSLSRYGECSRSLFEWAWLTVQTRGFGDDFLPHQLCLMPMLDMLNHSHHSPKISFLYSKQPSSFSLLAKHPLLPGEQLFDQYDQIPNAKLLDMHGFSLLHNPHDTYQLTLQADTLQHKRNFGSWNATLHLKLTSLDFDLIRFIKAKGQSGSQVISTYKTIMDR